MFTAPLLVAGLLTLGPQPQPPPAFPTLTAQAQARAHSIVLAQDTQPAVERQRDPLWDGPAKGALLGGMLGLVGGFVGYGQGGGEWPDRAPFVTATTIFGAAVGAATGLVLDIVKR